MGAILVTGATGFIGKNLVPALLESGKTVFAMQRNQELVQELDGAILISCKLEQVPTHILEKVEIVVHLAASGVNQEQRYDLRELYASNVNSPYSLILEALDKGAKKIINISSCFEHGYSALRHGKLSVYHALMPQTQYAATKAALTTMLYPLCNYYNADIYNIRAFNLYGEHERANRLFPSVKKCINESSVLKMTHGSQIKYFSHVDTIVQRILHLVEAPFKGSYFRMENHGEGNEMSVYTFARSLFELQGLNPSEHIERSKPSRINEPQVLVPDLTDVVEYFGEPQP